MIRWFCVFFIRRSSEQQFNVHTHITLHFFFACALQNDFYFARVLVVASAAKMKSERKERHFCDWAKFARASSSPVIYVISFVYFYTSYIFCRTRCHSFRKPSKLQTVFKANACASDFRVTAKEEQKKGDIPQYAFGLCSEIHIHTHTIL